MNKADKLLLRLQTVPKDFTWQELVSVMEKHGFTLYSGSGSGRKFIHADLQITVAMHEPHPGNIVKPYALRLAIAGLKQTGAIDE